MIRSFAFALCCFALLTASAWAQIVMPEEVEPYKPIVAGCDCIVPKNGAIQFMWKVDALSDFIQVEDGAKSKLHIWAPPGQHWVEAIVVTQTFREIVVFIPDPAAPTDISKAKMDTIKVSESLLVDRYEKRFVVKKAGPGPGPGPDPDPDPDPGPVDGMAGKLREALKLVPATAYTKAKAQAIGDNYLTIGSQGSDPARSTGWNLETFRANSKTMNTSALGGVDGIAPWAPFFKELARVQAELFATRKLTVNDVQKIALLWTESGEAIKKAAF